MWVRSSSTRLIRCMMCSRAPQIAFQEACLWCVDVYDPEPALLPTTPGHHRTVDVNVIVGLIQMQRDGQFSAYRDCLFGVHAASLRRQVPDKSSAPSLFIEKERRPANGDASIGAKTKALWRSHGRQSSAPTRCRRSPIRMKVAQASFALRVACFRRRPCIVDGA